MKVKELDCRYSSYSGPRRLLHWGPITAIAIILWISSFAVYCDTMFWPVSDGLPAIINLSIFCTWTSFDYNHVVCLIERFPNLPLHHTVLSVFGTIFFLVMLILYHHYRAAALGPGFVPLKWTPKLTKSKPEEVLQYCKVCQGYKAPRSHHCRKCNRCVMKMDHHCPWINVCCGHMNHANFTYFLFFAPIGCIHAMWILGGSLYYGINIRWYMKYGTGKEPLILFNLVSLVGSMFAVGLALGVTISVGILFIIQIKSIWKNRTGIEDWIEQKADYRDLEEDEEDFVYPYDVGCWRNIRQVLFRLDGWPESDGFWWSVKDECNQYTLTVEQMKQKEEKKQRATEYRATKHYSGYFLPVTQGLCVTCCFPWTDDPRIIIKPGDKVMVTRWRKYWLYGDKQLEHNDTGDEYHRERGWFPRRCAERVVRAFKQEAGDSPKNGATPSNGAGETPSKKRSNKKKD